MSASRRFPLLLLVASGAVVGAVWASQLWGGLIPCELCLYERWPYYAVIAASALALLAGDRRVTMAALAFTGLAFLAGAGLAFYHVGVEQHWFAGPSACTGAGPADSIEALRQRLLAQQPVQCDQPQWSLFGVTLAGWNVLASLVLAFGALWALRRPSLRRAG